MIPQIFFLLSVCLMPEIWTRPINDDLNVHIHLNDTEGENGDYAAQENQSLNGENGVPRNPKQETSNRGLSGLLDRVPTAPLEQEMANRGLAVPYIPDPGTSNRGGPGCADGYKYITAMVRCCKVDRRGAECCHDVYVPIWQTP